jgi:uncharacterized protein involved in outer membrane biogenesis
LRKAAIGLGILVVLVAAGLVLAPHFVDLDRLRAPIAAQLAKRTGLPVELAGPIDLALLPVPTLTARDVRIANPPGAAVTSMVRLRALEVKPALLPLLAGRLELESATLVEPEIDIERLADGTLNWRLGSAAAADEGRNSAGGAPSPVESGTLDRLVVENGAVTWRRAEAVERFEHINATLALDETTGGLVAAGDLAARGASFRFELTSGALDAATVPLQLTVTTEPAARLRLDATLTGIGDQRRIAGKLAFKGTDARSILGTLLQRGLPASLAQPVAVTADVAGSWRGLALDHLAVDLGPAHGEGSLHVDAGAPPDIALTLSIPRLDLDHWPVARKAALAPASPFLGRAYAATAASEAAIPTAPVTASRGLPADIRASVEIGAEAIGWHGGLIRDARLKASLADGRLTLSRLTAQLPGGSDASFRGSGALTPSGPRAEGVAEFDADDLRSLLGWFGVDIAAVPADRLGRANLSGRWALAGDRLDLTNVDATLDTTRLSGAATVLLRARPGLGVRIAADQLNLDAYLPRDRSAAPAPSGAAAAGSPRTASGVGGLLARFDANLDGRIKELTWRGQPIRDLHLSATLQNGDATIHELSVDEIGGAKAHLSGVVENLAGVPSGQLAFDMAGPELERVLPLISPRLAVGRSYGTFSLGGGVQCRPDKISVDTDVQLLDGHLHVAGDIVRASGALDLGFALDHPSFERFVQVFSPSYQPSADPGALKLSGRIDGDWSRFRVKELALAIGQSTLAGTLGVDLSGAKPQLDADLTAGDWVIDRLLSQRQTALNGRAAEGAARGTGVVLAALAAPAPAPGEAAPWPRAPLKLAFLRPADVTLKLAVHSLSYAGWRIDAPVVSASVKDGVLSLASLAGRTLDGSIAASGTLDARAVPSFQGRLTLKDADLKSALSSAGGAAWLNGRFDVDATLSSNGAAVADLVAHAAGDGTLDSKGGSIAGVNLPAADKALQARSGNLLALLRSAAGGRTAFSSLEGSFHIADGIATSNDLHLAAEGGEGSATARLDLPAWTMTSRVELHLAAAPDAPPLALQLDGPIGAPRIVFDVNAVERYLAARAATPTAPGR